MELKGEEEYLSTAIASSAHSPETISFFTPERHLPSPPSSGPNSPYLDDTMDEAMQVGTIKIKVVGE